MPHVCLTGGTGFLGRHATERLLAAGHRVTSLQRQGPNGEPRTANAAGDRFSVLPVRRGYPGLVEKIVELGPDVIVNLAAVSRGGEEEDDVRAMVEANLLLPSLLGLAAVRIGTTALIQCGTSWQTSGDGPEYDPFNYYAGTKQAAEDLLGSFARRGLRCISLRMFDNYGPGDTRRKIVDLLFDSAIDGTALKMSPGQQKMDLVYIEDAARAIEVAVARAMAKAAPGLEVFAVRSGTPVALRDVAGLVAAVSGIAPPIEWGGRPYRTGEIMEPNATVPTLPGWAPEVALREGLGSVWKARRKGGRPGEEV